MAQQGRPLFSQSVKAAGNITSHRFVGFDGNQATVQGQKCAGIAQFAAKQNDIVGVTMAGSDYVETGAALNPGDYVISDNQGRAIPANQLAIAAGAVAMTSTAANGVNDITGSYTAENILGQVLPGQVAAGAGAFVEIKLR